MPPLVDHPENFGLQHSSEIGRDRTRGTLQHFIFGEEVLERAFYNQQVQRSSPSFPNKLCNLSSVLNAGKTLKQLMNLYQLLGPSLGAQTCKANQKRDTK